MNPAGEAKGWVLAIDTSTLTMSLALARAEPGRPYATVGERSVSPPAVQSAALPWVVEEFVRVCGAKLLDVRAVVVGLGPGSFTGVRLGHAFAKAYSYATGARLWGVSSMEALAMEGPPDVPLLVLVPSRRGEFCVGELKRTGTALEWLASEEIQTEAWVFDRLRRDETAVALGPAVSEHPEIFERHPEIAGRLLSGVPFPRASALLTRWPHGKEETWESLAPRYGRLSAAEENPKFSVPAANLLER